MTIYRSWGIALVATALMTFACGKKKTDQGARAEERAGKSLEKMAVPTIVGDRYYRELAVVHARYGQNAAAAQALHSALEVARDARGRMLAYQQLGEIRESIGDVEGAAGMLEKALTEAGAVPEDRALSLEPVRYDCARRLARHYQGLRLFEKAETLLRQTLPQVRSPDRRNKLVADWVEIARKAETLPERIAQWEQVLAKGGDEGAADVAIAFLTAAYRPAPGATSGDKPNTAALIGLYETRLASRPGDARARRALLSLYEAEGRVDDAVALVRKRPEAPVAALAPVDKAMAACPEGLSAVTAYAPKVATAEEIVQLYLRAGRKEDALTTIATLEAGAKKNSDPTVARLAAARLYQQLGRKELAVRALDGAERAARTRDQRRRVASARLERLSIGGGKPGARAALLRRFKQSEDPCLRAEAVRVASLTASPAR